MKVSTQLLLLAPAICAYSFMFTACTNNPRTVDSKVAETINEPDKLEAASQQNRLFLEEAAQLLLTQTKVASMAQTRGGAQVKAVAADMEKAHSKVYNELIVLGQNKGLVLPSDLTGDASTFANTMQNASAADFDKSYKDIMVGDHRRTEELLTRISAESNDPDIREWAQNSLAVLQEQDENAASLNR